MPNDGLQGRDYASRIGVKASTDLGNGLTGVGVVEYGLVDDEGVTLNQKGQATLRLGYVGLKGAFGEVYYGSQTTLWHKYVRGPYFSDANDSVRLGTTRKDDLTQYYYNGENFSVGVSMRTEGQDGDDIDDYSVGGQYNFGPAKVALAYVKDESGDNTGEMYGARVWYDVTDAFALSAYYHQASKDMDAYGNFSGNVVVTGNDGGRGVTSCTGSNVADQGIYAGYKFGSNMVHGRVALDSCSGDIDGDTYSYKVEYVRFLAKNYRVWASYEALDMDDTRVATSAAGNEFSSTMSETQLGVRYDF